MSALRELLDRYREAAESERQKGDAFERLIQFYLINDPKYDFSGVWLWREWAELEGKGAQDVGIDLVAKDRESGVVWAIQCKFYAEDAKIYKHHIDSFFTESGKEPFGHRLIVLTTSETSEHVDKARHGQQIPCSTLNLLDLEESLIDWSSYAPGKKASFREKYDLRTHQKKAFDKVIGGFEKGDRGKLIMACGTGKTFTALRIAEEVAGAGKTALFLVPSLNLLSQTLAEWTAQSVVPLHAFAVCSDSSTGKRKSDDLTDLEVSDLAYPATTNSSSLAEKLSHEHPDKMTVVFSTYHSIKVLSEAQKEHGVGSFDLIICDEAHRTTGATAFGARESHFVKVHDQDFISADKRLYMTATPRVFGDVVKAKADEVEATLCSMDDETLYGPVFHTVTFSEAVRRGLLSDYKVLVLAIDEAYASGKLQSVLAQKGSELPLDDASKILGCWRALSKWGVKEDLSDDERPMGSAVAFCKDIKTSKMVTEYFPQVVDEFIEQENLGEDALLCELNHVDGTYPDFKRRELLAWLKGGEDKCRILTNARCLSEGIDVPSLDSILFLNPRKSQIDIVQSVGRVMRKSPGKTRGYVVLPIVVPAGLSADVALDQNERYRVVWQVLQALRSHDDRFEALINKIDLGADVSDKLEIIGVGGEGEETDEQINGEQQPLDFSGLEKAICAKIVKKCGNRKHWEEWAGDIAKIANTHITRITTLLEKDGTSERQAFDEFLHEIRDDLNESVTEGEAIEMLAQHIITKPVFDALFKDHEFAASNPVSQAMEGILKILHEQNLENESESLSEFYESIRFRAEGIESSEGRQRIILELYDKFFRNAFPRLTEKLGIVYTPVEVVDFIIHSVNDVLKNEFGESLGSKGVHILDPFVGTGTFITRLIQSGLISKEELPHKYKHEIHCNEIVLLAYYIAAINIESVYHDLVDDEYQPFGGICLTDTFQLYEKDDMISSILVDNSTRRARQKELDIKVILGNPPYSAGQGSANDENKNVLYPYLDESIRTTYAAHTDATNKNSLYDSYIRAIRWASDRIGSRGMMAYVTNAGWVESNACDGMRKCLAEDFSSLYIFHLRGNQRTQGEQSRREGGKIFGSGSRAPIAISLLVKNPEAKEVGRIYFHDIGDYLSREDKLTAIRHFKSISGIDKQGGWSEIKPDQYHDWVNQRDDSFYEFIKIGDKKDRESPRLFSNYSSGLKTNRDAWCYNFSKNEVSKNMERMIDFYNSEVDRFQEARKLDSNVKVASFIDTDTTKISWNRGLKNDFTKFKNHAFDRQWIVSGVYRPFMKSWAYFSREMNDMIYQMPRIFPSDRVKNRVIAVTGVGAGAGFSCLMADCLTNLHFMDTGQNFPLKLFEKQKKGEQTSLLGGDTEGDYTVKDGITDEGLKHFVDFYEGENIEKEDIFYYIYGVLHHERYREKYADNLSKELPRIPRVKTFTAFSRFVEAGKKLGELHVGYEKQKPYPVRYRQGEIDLKSLSPEDLYVKKMKFGKGKDKTTVVYNYKITMTDIPLEAYEYVVNGKPALEWVMDRQVVRTDKKSGIVNDCNRFAVETMKDPAYPLKLFQRVITVSLETMKIVKALPKLDI